MRRMRDTLCRNRGCKAGLHARLQACLVCMPVPSGWSTSGGQTAAACAALMAQRRKDSQPRTR
eukprot:365528-Chlamydomonas_euryale.AAC.9